MLEELLDANKEYAGKFALAGLAPRAAKGLALLTCMDSRIEPLAMLSLKPGDAKILRNAGGRVTPDVLRSLVFATSFLGVDSVVVMQHTKCALSQLSELDVESHLRSAGLEVGDWEFLTMEVPDEALASDVEAIRSCLSLPPGLTVQGWRYDVDDGSVAQIIL
ncbi:MAG: carbonic anhydrase [Actinomycetota bacterium]|nr:MAG: carbonic anhydrase [Actinomycetota bacterium]